MKYVCLTLLLLLTLSNADAQDTYSSEPMDNGWSLYVDQDLLAIDFVTGWNEDRDYTMGIAAAYSGQRVKDWYGYSYLQKGIEHLFNDEQDSLSKFHTASWGITAFSPDNLNSFEPVLTDRPYSNLVFASMNETQVFRMSQYAESNTLVIGVLGSNVGKALQRQIHCDWELARQCPSGWPNQISHGGELTFLIRHHRTDLQINGDIFQTKQHELTTYYEWDFGYYVDAAVGFSYRIGKIDSPFYASMMNPLSAYNHAGGKKNTDDHYFYVSFGARAFLYNALLQGQFRDSRYTLSYSEMKPLIAEASIGYVFEGEDVTYRYALHYRSSEIEHGLGDREHFFGGLYFDFHGG